MGNTWNNIVTKCSKDNAKFLFLSAAAGWVLASAAQTMGIVVNKNIEKDEKKFLIPQEIMDGTVNIGLYALITAPLISATDKLIEAGKVGFKGVEKGTKEFARLKGGAKVIASIAGAVISSNILTPIARNKIGSIAQRKALVQKVQQQEPNYSPNYQPLVSPVYKKIPTNMNNYVTFTKNNGMKI